MYPNEFPLSQITLLEGPLKHARDLNIETLLKYDCDRLMAPYRKEAGLTPKAKCYPNWDGLDGHVGGHPEEEGLELRLLFTAWMPLRYSFTEMPRPA